MLTGFKAGLAGVIDVLVYNVVLCYNISAVP